MFDRHLRSHEAGGREPIKVTWWPTRPVRRRPLGFDQALLGHAHEQRVERARRQACRLHQFVAMAPATTTIAQRRDKSDHLLRGLANTLHQRTQLMSS